MSNNLLGILKLVLILSLLCCSAFAWAQPNFREALAPQPLVIEEWLETTVASTFPAVQLVHKEQLLQLYQRTEYNNLWLDAQGRPNAAAQQLLTDLKPWLYLEAHPRLEHYHQLAELLTHPVNTHLPRQRQATDILATDLFFIYLNDLLTGYWASFDVDDDQDITNAYERWDDWPDEVERSSVVAEFPLWLVSLNYQTAEDWALNLVEQHQPNQDLYQPLRQAFARLDALVSLGDWPRITSTLGLGQQSAEVTRLALQLERLQDLASIENYLPVEFEEPVFDKALEAALIRFQQRHQLSPTGKTDAATRAWLNLNPVHKMRLLAHNLRRLQHLPKYLHERHLMVNLASQELSYVEAGQERLNMKIVVGRDGLRTPIMNQWLTSIVLNPLWNVPNSIARRSVFPNALRNPDQFVKRDYALVEGWSSPARFVPLDQVPANAFEVERPSYRIVQKSGNYNQLGRAKYRLSNQQAIYLHDTPYRHVFNKEQRDLSAGCVRVENSELLAETILTSAGVLSEQQLAAIYASAEERYLTIKPRVAVYLMYWTAQVDKQGQVHWFADSYAKDTLEHNPARYAKNN